MNRITNISPKSVSHGRDSKVCDGRKSCEAIQIYLNEYTVFQISERLKLVTRYCDQWIDQVVVETARQKTTTASVLTLG